VLSFVPLPLKVCWFPLVANNSNPLWHGVEHDDYGEKKVDSSLKQDLWHKKYWVEEICDIQATGRQCCEYYEDEKQKSNPGVLCFSTINNERCADCERKSFK
jgi:hypothetical protein